ncbi:MAG: HEPN domain-containing protein [Desulfobacterales bacterium]|nr:HEPN domain-containing protein [Desulfobacterales bacterium]
MKETEKEARRWFLQAEDDLRFVNWIRKEGVFFDKGCFMSQQAGEKALKACLYATGKRRILGHSLFEMVEELSRTDEHFQTILNPAKRLDRFYIPTRYPNGLPGGSPFQVYTVQDLTEAYEDVKTVFQVSRTFLEKVGL